MISIWGSILSSHDCLMMSNETTNTSENVSEDLVDIQASLFVSVHANPTSFRLPVTTSKYVEKLMNSVKLVSTNAK